MTSYLPILLLLFVIHYDMGAEVFKCPAYQIKFEKLIGLRPNIQQPRTLLYKSDNNNPVTLDCLNSCVQDTNCMSFVLYYNSSECYAYRETSMPIQNYDYDSRSDTNIVWFRKTCIENPVCLKAWIFEVVSGSDFIGYDTKDIGNVTRQQCINNCARESTFLCRSIKFFVGDTTNSNPYGMCILSDADRHLIPNSFRVSRYENEYIENQCVNSSSTEYCAYDEYEDTTLTHTDLSINTINEEQCRQTCDMLPDFNCRGYSILPRKNNIEKYRCLLHSEDSKLIGPKLLVNLPGAKYYERVRCLNVSASCTDQLMTLTYRPEQPFVGRIYANGFSDTKPCYADGRYNESVVLKIPFGQNKCGLNEDPTSTTSNRHIRPLLLVIQYNALIQTQADRYIRVGCPLGQENDEITLSTNINFTNSHPNKGSTIINDSSVLPMVTIKVVDYDTKQPTSDTDIGQQLQLIIEIKPGNGPYDIWAGHLVATSENGQDSILLLDDKGCPTQTQIFQSFTKVLTSTSRMLVSSFQAFKFTSSTVVRFSVMVHFCTLTCPTINCSTHTRTKRNTNDIVSNATVLPITRENGSYVEEMPLDVMLIVRGSLTKSDQLVIGKNNMIFIAGADWGSNDVCIDYALVVGLAVCWIMLQIIILVCCFFLIRKYKKYFDIAYTRHLDDQQFGLGDTHQSFGLGGENLSRRVRWADQ